MWEPIGRALQIVVVFLAITAAAKQAGSQEACSEAVTGVCFQEFTHIAAVTSRPNGFSAIGVRGKRMELLSFDSDSKITSRREITRPKWASEETVLFDVKDLIAGPDASLLLVGTAEYDLADQRIQAGFAVFIQDEGGIRWSEPIKGSKSDDGEDAASVIFHSGIYDESQGQFLIAGRETIGGGTADCRNWSRAAIFVLSPEDLSFNMYRWNEVTQGLASRMAFYAILPTHQSNVFVAAGFASADDGSGQSCKEDALLVQLSTEEEEGGALTFEDATSGGRQDTAEDIFAAARIDDSQYLIVGEQRDANAAWAAIAELGATVTREDLFAFPDVGTDGRDRYRDIVPLRTPGRYLLVGSVSESKKAPNRGFWRFASVESLTLEEPKLLTEKVGSDIFSAALGDDGRVLAVGKISKKEGTVGWIGLLNDYPFEDLRRSPDNNLDSIAPLEIANGSYNLLEKDVRQGMGLQGASLAIGSTFELRFTLSEKVDVAVTSLTSRGDLDLLLVDMDERIIRFSSNLGDAAEYLRAQLPPGSYKLKLVAVSQVDDFELRVHDGKQFEDVVAKLLKLDSIERQILNRRLEEAGYTGAGNANIALGGDTYRSVVAFYSAFHRPGSIQLDDFIERAAAVASDH